MLACSLGLLSAAFPPGPSRANATAGWGASVGAGTGLGGVLTVLLDPGTGWRTTYLVTAGPGPRRSPATARLVLPDLGTRTRRRVDVVGPGAARRRARASCWSAWSGTRSGLGTAAVVAFLALGDGLLVAFVLVESRLAEPLVDLALFRVPGFVGASLGALVTGAAVVGLMSFLATVLQRALGESLLSVTLLVLVWSAVSTVTALAVRWLPAVDGRLLLAARAGGVRGRARRARRPAARTGRRCGCCPAWWCSASATARPTPRSAGRRWRTCRAERAAMGSGANNTARYVGAAVGVTLVVLVAVSGAPAGTPAGLAGGWNTAALAGAALSAAGAVAVLLIRPRRPLSAGPTSQEDRLSRAVRAGR